MKRPSARVAPADTSTLSAANQLQPKVAGQPKSNDQQAEQLWELPPAALAEVIERTEAQAVAERRDENDTACALLWWESRPVFESCRLTPRDRLLSPPLPCTGHT